MSAELTEQHLQSQPFESTLEGDEVRFWNSPRFTVQIPRMIPKTTLRLIPVAMAEGENALPPGFGVLSTFGDHSSPTSTGALFFVPNQLPDLAIFLHHVQKFEGPIIDASLPNPRIGSTVYWSHRGENSSQYLTVTNGVIPTTIALTYQFNSQLLMNDMVIGCDQSGNSIIFDGVGQPRENGSLPSYLSCETGMIGEKNGECFGLVKKEDGDQARLHLVQKSDLTEYRQSIPIDDESNPGVLSEDCTMHAQKTKNGIRVTDIKNGGITKEIQLDGMEPGQIMFFDNASKVIVSAEGNLCHFQVMDAHSRIELNTAQIHGLNGCTNLVKWDNKHVAFLSREQDDNVIINVLKCHHACRLIHSLDLKIQIPVHRQFSLPSPNHNHVVVRQRSFDNLSVHHRIAIINIQNGEVVNDWSMTAVSWFVVQWKSDSSFVVRYFHHFSMCIEMFSLQDGTFNFIGNFNRGKNDFEFVGFAYDLISFPYDARLLSIRESSFTVDTSQDDWKRNFTETAIRPDDSVNQNRHFSINGKWLIIHEKHPSDEGKGLIKWFHSDSLDLHRSCEYPKNEIQSRKMLSCWMDSETNVYSDGSKIKVQKIGVGILDEMDIGYIPTALQCANGFILTSSDKGVIHAWNLTVRAQSQSAHRLPVIGNPFCFRSPISRANRSTQTESVLAYPERVRTLQMRAERGSVLATAEGYRSEPARKPHYALVIGGIAAGVLLVSVLIALLIWMRVRRANERSEGKKTGTVAYQETPIVDSIQEMRARILTEGECSLTLPDSENDDDDEGAQGTGNFIKEDSFSFLSDDLTPGQTAP